MTPIPEKHVPTRSEMDAFNNSSYYTRNPAITFGTGSRAPLGNASEGPGPGAYAIKSTMFKLSESDFRTPSQFSLRSRTKFGDPNEKTMNKAIIAQPGPGTYKLDGKFLFGKDPRKIKFPKGADPVDKGSMGPGPGSYKNPESMGKQVL